jgi:hypothetical protein
MGTMILREEVMVLRHYEDGDIIEPRDQKMIDRLASIGLVKLGLDLDTMQETTRPTALGRKILQDIKY